MNSEDLTATPSQVLKGYIAGVKDNDDPQPGEMEVNSLLSFSCAAYSGSRVLAKWQNPKAAKGKPYSGVVIRYSTSGSPGKIGGSQVYKGAGNNTESEGQSQAYVDLPAISTAYYLSCIPYVTTSQGELLGDALDAAVTTGGMQTAVIRGTQTYTIPAGYSKVDLFAVGGGGGGSYGTSYSGGGGGGGGYTKTVKAVSVEPGDILTISIGGGGYFYNAGGATSIVRNGTVLLSTLGGKGSGNGSGTSEGGSGGSGGGEGGVANSGFNGGSNGSNAQYGGRGQGSTTRAFGEPSGTLYAGGGGGGAYSGGQIGYGGAGGGGNGGTYAGYNSASNGGANTGGGAGGKGRNTNNPGSGMTGGSGIALIRLY